MYVIFKIKDKEFGFDTGIIVKFFLIILAIILILNISLVGAIFSNTNRFIFGSARRYEKNLKILKNGVEQYQNEIVLNNIKSGTERSRLIHEILEGTPEIFYIDSMRYKYYNDTTVVYVSYRYSKEALENAKIDYEKRIDKICQNIDSNLSDYKKVLYIHDYIADNFYYDYSTEDTIHDAYRMLLKGKGVCSAYANLFKALCNKVGLKCEVVWTKLDNHDWNVVKINGFWYNVDVTWDDTGAGDKEYFLVPDTLIWGGGHRQWTNCGKYKISCFNYWYAFKKNSIKK